MKKKRTDNRAGFNRWLLENSERIPEADAMLKEILGNVQPSPEDTDLASSAYEDFRTEVKRRQRISAVAGRFQRAAALIAVPLAVGLVFSMLSDRQSGWEEIYTMTGETRTVVLPDSSVMKLAPHSKIVYPEKFGRKERHIFLTGEAYADIMPDSGCPFRISAGDMEVRVLGTQFSISAYLENTECEVALVEGSVERTFIPEYFKEVEMQDGCQFLNMRFVDIASYLERRFGVKIFIADESIGNERFYASFINGEGVDEILEILNMEGRFSIRRNGNTVLIE